MLFKNKLIINDNLFYDNYNNYINLYDDMVGKNNNYDKNIFRFIHNYNTMFYILYKSSLLISKKYLKQSVNIKKYNLINFFSFNNINNIIKYKFNYSYSIMTIEILIETIKFKKNIPLKILDIENILKSPLIESINYLNKNNDHEYNLLLFPKYNFTFLKDKNIMSQKDISFLKKFNTNIMINNNYLNIDFIKNNKNKYDIINNGLRAIDLSNNTNYDGPFIEIASTQIFFLIFLFAITHLNKGGYLILHIGSVTTKPVADILVLGKKYFKNVVLYQNKIKTWQYTGVSAIFQEFKSINQKDINKLLKIAEKLLKNDPTSLDFTINNDKIRKEYNFTKPKNKKYKYIDEFINTPITSPEYNFIRESSNQIYLEKMILLDKLLVYKKKYYNPKYNEIQIKNSVPKDIREKQLIEAIMYCKRYGLETIIDDKGTFKSDFGKMIIKDLYSIHNPISIKLLKSKTKKKIGDINLLEELNKLSKDYNMSVLTLESRKIPAYMLVKHQISFYQAHCQSKLFSLNEYVSNKYTKYKVTREWLSFQEIINTFNIINSNLKNIYTFHLNEAPGYFIKSLCYYMKKNKKCIKCFEWAAQTLDPSVDSSFTNEYDLLTLYQNRWNFGITEDGDITKVENLKSYKDSCKKIKLMTADGGIKNLSNNISLNKLKLSEIAFMFYNLPKNGNFVIRLYIPIDKALMIDLIYLINKKFKTVYFYKPLENIYSGEFYLIALNYQGLEEKYMNKILRLLNKYNNETMNKLITKGNYNNSFKNQIFNVLDKFIQNYNFNINKQIYYLDNKKYIPNEHYRTIDRVFNEKNKEWVNKFLSK